MSFIAMSIPRGLLSSREKKLTELKLESALFVIGNITSTRVSPSHLSLETRQGHWPSWSPAAVVLKGLQHRKLDPQIVSDVQETTIPKSCAVCGVCCVVSLYIWWSCSVLEDYTGWRAVLRESFDLIMGRRITQILTGILYLNERDINHLNSI